MSCICENQEATQVTINGIVYCETVETMLPSCKPKSCPPGYTLSEDGTECILPYNTGNLCPNGYLYVYVAQNPEESYCQASNDILADCLCTADVIASPQTICSGDTTSIALTSTVPTGIVYSWVVLQDGVDGGTAGNSIDDGNIITQELTATGLTNGTAIYTITPYEGSVNGCSGTPIQVTVTVKPIPNILAVPISPQTITSGDTLNIALSSGLVGTTFTWTSTADPGVTGANSGAGTTITDTLTCATAASVTYTIVATAPNGCTNTLVYTVNIGATVEECLAVLTARVFYDNLGKYSLPYASRNINVTGTSGSGNIIIDGTPYAISFNTSITQTVTDFNSAHYSALLALGISISGSGTNINILKYSATAPVVTFSNTSGNLFCNPSTPNLGIAASSGANYTNFSAFPATGAIGTVYVALDTNIFYTWNGTAYVTGASTEAYNTPFWSAESSTTGHGCNRARYNFMTNGVPIDCYHYLPADSILPSPTNIQTPVSYVNLNNAGTPDDFNRIVYGRFTSPSAGDNSSRESFVEYSTTKSAIIEEGLSTSANTLKIRLRGTNIVTNPVVGGTVGTLIGTFYDQHSNVVGLQFFIDGVSVYDGVIGSRILEIDPCNFVTGQELIAYESSTGGTSRISDITIGTQTGTLTSGVSVTPSTVTQNIIVDVTALGTYDFIGYANGVTFRAKGTFTTTGSQTVTMEALGTPITAGVSTFELDLAIPEPGYTTQYWRVPPTFNFTVL
jgi:hypothetical protein